MRFWLLVLATAVAIPQSASGCIPPAPPIRLHGESDTAYKDRSHAFHLAALAEERRAVQTRLYDSASRVSIARVLTATKLSGVLSDGISTGRRVEAQPVAVLKGAAGGRKTVALQDAGMTSCGRYGGGTATAAEPGDYILLFENVSVDAITGQHGIFLTEISEPRVLQSFGKAVQQAGLGATGR